MKKSIIIIYTLVLTLSLTACTTNQVELENNEASKTVKNNINAEIETYSFEDAVQEASLIVEVQISELVKEISDPSAKTIFKVKVLDTIKSDHNLNSNFIHVMQQGNSEWIFNGNELFKQDEKYILVLKKAVSIDIENTYWILGEETGMYKIIDNTFIAKLSQPDEELQEIEEVKLSSKLTGQQIETKQYPKSLQVLNKQQFKQKVERFL